MKSIILNRLYLSTKKQPLDRYRESRRLGVSERRVRELIRELRLSGVRVCSDSAGKGYWIAEDEQDYAQFRAEMWSRVYRTLELLRAMDGLPVDGQLAFWPSHMGSGGEGGGRR
jgi:biotin operon repressor